MSPPESVQFVTLGRADGMSFIFTFVPLSPQVSCPVSRPGRHCTHSYDSCVIARKLTLRKKTQSIKGAVSKPVHPPLQRERQYLYYSDQETNLSSDSERGIIFIILDYLQGQKETSFIILENKQTFSLPGEDLQISLNKTINAFCSEDIQICQDYLSALPFNMFCFGDSEVSLGVRTTQACLLALTPEGKSFYLILCIIMNSGFRLFK